MSDSMVCPRHGIPVEPSILTKEGKDSYEMSCGECEYEQMFRGTPPAIAPRPLTLEEFTRLIPADWRESLQLTGRIPSEPAGGGGRRE